MPFDPKTAPHRNDWYGWLRRIEVGNYRAKWVLAAICMRIDDSLSAFPERSVLFTDTEMPKSTLTKWIAYLRDHRLLFTFATKDRDGAQTANLYVPNINGWLDDCQDSDEILTRIQAVHDYNKANQLLPTGATLSAELSVPLAQVEPPARYEQGGAAHDEQPSCSEQVPPLLITSSLNKEVKEELQDEVKNPPLPPTDVPASAVPDPVPGGGDSSTEETRSWTADAVQIWRTSLNGSADSLNHEQKNQLVDRMVVVLESGCTVEVATEKMRGVDKADYPFAAACKRLCDLEKAAGEDEDQYDPFGTQRPTGQPEGPVPAFCTKCSGGPRSWKMYRRVIISENRYGEMCECNPNHPMHAKETT
jgi:hypothetical protein